MQTKKQFKYFTIANHKSEEDYLRNMHKQGWKLVRVSGLCIYNFESCEPEDVVYQLDYNPQRNENMAEYLKIFSDCGWEYIQDYVGYSYFRKRDADMNGEENIFNDSESKCAMLERVFKGRMIPLLFIFFASLLPLFTIYTVNGNFVPAAITGGLLALYIIIFIFFAITYFRSKRNL